MLKNLFSALSFKKLFPNSPGQTWKSFFSETKNKILHSPEFVKIKTKVTTHPKFVILNEKLQNLEWKEKIILCLVVCAFFLFLIAPYSLLFRESKTLVLETEKRGESLTRLLAASNQVALAEDKSIFYSTASVVRELGVKDAWIIDTEGNILAPAERFGQTLTDIKTKTNPESCTRWASGLNYQFACPIFKWVEANFGFQKQVTGYAYIDYTAASALNAISYRGFELFKYITWFGLCFGVMGYFVIAIVKKPLLDLKFGLRSFTRGASTQFPEPQHFSELKDLSLEIREFVRNQNPSTASAAKNNGDTHLKNIFDAITPFLKKDVVFIDDEKIVSYVSPTLKEKFHIEDSQHLIRAFQNTVAAEEIMRFISETIDAQKLSSVKTFDAMGEVEMLAFFEKGKMSYFLLFQQ